MLKRIDVTVRVLTPLHIGTGRKLARDYDFVARNGRTYRLREDALVEGLDTRDPKLTEQLRRTCPGQLLRPDDLKADSPFVRYVLSGEPQEQEVREGIKDSHDRPYLPGSSLKGALRTVLAWHGWKQLQPGLASTLSTRNPKFAARPLEQAMFGRDPHHDLLRALRVSDSAPVPSAQLAIEVVQVWTRRGPAASISVEAVRPGTEFRVQVSVDEALFSDWSRQKLGFPLPHRDWIDSIPSIATKRAAERLESEQALWNAWGRPGNTNPYQPELAELLTRKASSSAAGFPLQLGFGTGWEGTTIGAPLRQDPNWDRVFQQFRLGHVPARDVQVSPGGFPTSRRVVGVAGSGNRLLPLGWIWVEWKEVA